MPCLKDGSAAASDSARCDYSRLLHKLRLQLHCADAINLAIDVVIAVNQLDVLYFGANFDYQ